MKILLVDDSVTMRRILKNVLGKAGFTDIDEAENGEEALRALTSALPDVILLDWHMPQMDGLEFLKHLQASSLSQKPPVIMVTSVSAKEKILEAVTAGASDYVTKPFSPKIIREKIDRVTKGGT